VLFAGWRTQYTLCPLWLTYRWLL